MRRYRQATVTRAYRAVLRMAIETIRDLPDDAKHCLRVRRSARGSGTVTLAEVEEHARQALELRVRRK